MLVVDDILMFPVRGFGFIVQAYSGGGRAGDRR